MAKTNSVAQLACEEYLQDKIRDCREQQIAPSEIKGAERLLARSSEATSVYEEIYPELSRDGIAWKVFINCLLSTKAYSGPEQLAASRSDRDALIAVNAEIDRCSAALADLLDQRDILHNRSSFGSSTL